LLELSKDGSNDLGYMNFPNDAPHVLLQIFRQPIAVRFNQIIH
jgi:hypothetical protein